MIDIVFGQAEKDAKRLIEIGENISKAANSEIAVANETISKVWKSNEGTRYLNKSIKFKDDVNKSGKNIKSTGESYQNYVNTLKSIEDGAKSVIGNIGKIFS